MTQSPDSKHISLHPNWKHYFFSYLLGMLTTPLLGIGFLILFFTYKKHSSIKYKVTDTQISSVDAKYQRNIDLVDIEKVSIEQSWLQQKMQIGTLTLHTSASGMQLVGMENPQQLKTILEKAIRAERERIKSKQETKSSQPDRDPGSMEKMNYLTGLWQQGLISEEDFDEERRHFE